MPAQVAPLFDDFPKNHNLILIGQPSLLNAMNLPVHEGIKSRITYSSIMPKLTPDDILIQPHWRSPRDLDQIGLIQKQAA